MQQAACTAQRAGRVTMQYQFFFSYARDTIDNDSLLSRFFDDLCKEVRGLKNPALSTWIFLLLNEAVSREVFVLSVVDGLLVRRLLRPALISE